jgi:hypothetical protein
LALAAGPARADLIVYDFTDSQSANLMSGSFQVDTAAIQQSGGVLSASSLQAPDFKTSDGFEFKTFTNPFIFDVDTKTFDVLSATLNLKTASPTGPTLTITGTSGTGFQWVEQSSEGGVVGNGDVTITHTQVSAVPAPPTLALFGVGSLCLAGYAWRRHRLAVA